MDAASFIERHLFLDKVFGLQMRLDPSYPAALGSLLSRCFSFPLCSDGARWPHLHAENLLRRELPGPGEGLIDPGGVILD